VPFLDMELDGMPVRVSLNEQVAPLARKAICEALPFDDAAVHAQVSGDMFPSGLPCAPRRKREEHGGS
jgi:hypothetical protein